MAAGLTLDQVAERAGVSKATVSRLENDRYVPTVKQVTTLARAVGASASARRRAVVLAESLRERTASRQVLIRGGPAAQRRYGEIEAGSGHVQSFSPSMVVGLLQTERYARAVFASALPDEQIEDAVQARLQRQQPLLQGASTPQFTQVLTEGALRWHAVSPEVMTDQCEHIAELAERNDRVGIVSSATPTRLFAWHGFDLYDERAVIVGTVTGTAYLTAAGDVAEYVKLFGQLVAAAEFGERAAAVALRVAADYRRQA